MPRFNDLTTDSVNYGSDVRKRIVNVDAAYRESTQVEFITNRNGNRVTNFLFRLTSPVRNVTQMKVVSVEHFDLTFVGLYALLQINDESSIESRGGRGILEFPTVGTPDVVGNKVANGTELRAVAKLQQPLQLAAPAPTFQQEGFGLVTYPVTFRNPQDVTVLRVSLINPDGTIITAGENAAFSFTLELTEVVNSYLYESNRKHIGYDPANVRS